MSSRPASTSALPDGAEIDVFVSYSHQDRARIEVLVQGLEAFGLTVWCDARLEAGQIYDAAIRRALRAARVVLVCWSRRSVESDWVRAEATEGKSRATLASCLLEPCEPFPPFNLVHHEDLSTWRGESDDPAWRRLAASIARRPPGHAREQNLQARKATDEFGRRAWPVAMATGVVLSTLAAFQGLAPNAPLQSGYTATDAEFLHAAVDATVAADAAGEEAGLDQALGLPRSPPPHELSDLQDSSGETAPPEAPADEPAQDASGDETASHATGEAALETTDNQDILIEYVADEVIPTAEATAAVRAALTTNLKSQAGSGD